MARASPVVFEANFSYGYEKLAKEARAAPKKFEQKQREATGSNDDGAESDARGTNSVELG